MDMEAIIQAVYQLSDEERRQLVSYLPTGDLPTQDNDKQERIFDLLPDAFGFVDDLLPDAFCLSEE